MRGKNKGSNAMRTPSNIRITGEGSTNQRYKNLSAFNPGNHGK